MHIPSGTLIPDSAEGGGLAGILIILVFLALMCDGGVRNREITDYERSIYEAPTTRSEKTLKLQNQPRFVAREKFVVGVTDSAEVKIFSLSDGFAERFLDVIEEPTKEVELTACFFGGGTIISFDNGKGFDEDIQKELKKQKELLALSQFYFLLSKQGYGQDGTLLTDGNEIVFYIRTKGEPLAVYAYWDRHVGGWIIYTEEEILPNSPSVYVRRDSRGILTFAGRGGIRNRHKGASYQLIYISGSSPYQFTSHTRSITDAPRLF